MQLKDKLELLGKAIALATFLFTVLTFTYSSVQAARDARFQRTAEYINRFTAEKIQDNLNRFDVYFLPYYSALNFNDEKLLSSDRFSILAKAFLFGKGGNYDSESIRGFILNFVSTMNFFTEVYLCISSKSCDVKAAKLFFCPKVISFNVKFSRLITFYSEYSRDNDFGSTVQPFIEQCKMNSSLMN